MSPVVPKYQRQVDTNAIPNLRVNADAPLEAFGGGASAARLTEANIGTLQVVENIALKEKQKADDVIASDYFSKATRLKNDLLYDPKTGATNVNGEQVVQSDFVGEYEKRLDDGFNDLDKNLRNPEQRAYAAKLKGQIKNEYSSNLQRHYAQESTKYAGKSMLANVETLQNDSRLNWGDPNKIEENRKNIAGRISRYSQQYGVPKDVSDNQTTEAVSKMHVGVIESITTSGNDLAAQEYYNRITGKKIPGLVKSGNIDWANLPVHQNENGSRSSTVTMGFEEDGNEILVPTFWDGERHSPKEAITRYHETGKHLGIFSDEKSATAYVNNQLHPAQETGKKSINQLTGDDQSAIEKTLMVSKVDGEGQRRAAAIVSKYPTDLQSQLNELDKIKDIKIQDETRKRLHQRDAEQKAAVEQHKQNLVDGSVKLILDSKQSNPEPGTNYWDSVPASVKSQLTPKMEKEIMATVNPPPNTDWGVKGMLLDMASQDPDKFQRLRLQEYYPYLDISDRDELHKYQIGMEKQDRATMDKISKAKADKTALDTVAIGLNLDPSAKTKSPKGRAYSEFGRQATDELRAKSMALGRELTPDEQEDEYRKFGKKVAIQGPNLFGIQLPGSNKEIFKVNNVSQIPKNELDTIRKRIGRPVSDADLLSIWRRWKANAGD